MKITIEKKGERRKMKINFIPLTWIKSKEDLFFQIKNTLIIKRVLEKFHDPEDLGKLLKKTQYGFTSSANTHSGDYKMLRITDLKNGKVNWENVPFCDGECDQYLLKKRDIVIARTGNNKSFLIEDVPNNAVFASYLIRLEADEKLLLPEYLYIFLNSYVFWSQVIEMQTGTAIPNVNAEKLKKLIIPYCPIEEQKRIINQSFDINLEKEIAKIEKLLEYKENLSNRADHDKKLLTSLKQSILQEAVQGKLVSQNSGDEPASELLKKIKKEKENLIKEGKIKKQKELPAINDDEVPYGLPKGWVWCRLGEICILRRGASPRPISKYITKSNEGVNWIKIGDTSKGSKYLIETKEKITQEGAKKSVYVTEGELIMSNSMSFGEPYILKISGCIHDGWLSFNYPKKLVNLDFLYYLLLSQKIYYESKAEGTGVRNLNINKVFQMPIPIPPLPEQKRIVEKVDALMKLCDELELRIGENKANSEMLMNGVLREVFESR